MRPLGDLVAVMTEDTENGTYGRLRARAGIRVVGDRPAASHPVPLEKMET